MILCILKHVEDVKDRSSLLKGYNAMYVKDVKDGKRTYTHIFAHNFLNDLLIFNLQKNLRSWDLGLFNHTIKYCLYWSMLKMSEIDQVHLRAVMLFMLKTSKILKQVYIEFILFYVEDVRDVYNVYELQCRF